MVRILILALCALMAFMPVSALADGSSDDVVVISIVETPTPSPAATPPPTPEPQPCSYQEYLWTQDDIDTTAQVYWVWCNTAQEKADMTALIVNRVMCSLTRSDGSRMFPDTVENVVTQSGEFGIDKARCSDKNRELAVVNLNRCMTEWLMGNAGVRVPRSAIYADRVNGVLVMYDKDWNEVWRVEK